MVLSPGPLGACTGYQFTYVKIADARVRVRENLLPQRGRFIRAFISRKETKTKTTDSKRSPVVVTAVDKIAKRGKIRYVRYSGQ